MKSSEIPVLILVGGQGSRLASVTDQPKPLVTVAGRPFIHYLLAELHRQGFRQICFLSGYRAAAFERALTANDSAGPDAFLSQMTFHFLAEAEPLGTGGALLRALPHVPDVALVLNGDSFCEVDFSALLAVLSRPEAEFALTAVEIESAADFGALTFTPDGRVTGFLEKGSERSGWINAGVYAVTRQFLATAIPDRPCSLEREILPEQVKQKRVWIYCTDRLFHDIGTPERLAAADKIFRNR